MAFYCCFLACPEKMILARLFNLFSSSLVSTQVRQFWKCNNANCNVYYTNLCIFSAAGSEAVSISQSYQVFLVLRRMQPPRINVDATALLWLLLYALNRSVTLNAIHAQQQRSQASYAAYVNMSAASYLLNRFGFSGSTLKAYSYNYSPLIWQQQKTACIKPQAYTNVYFTHPPPERHPTTYHLLLTV